MTYSEIFKELYYENKKFFRMYVTICLIFSIFAFGNNNFAFASNGFTTVETVGILGGTFGKMLMPFIQGSVGGMDTPTVMMIFSIISLVLDFMPETTLATLDDAIRVVKLSDYSFGLLEFNVVRIIFIVWFLADKLSKSNRVTYTTGVILENLETKIRGVVHFLIVVSQFLANMPAGITVQAASATSQTVDVVKYSFNALICFVLLISLLVIYIFIQSLFMFISIILLPVCTTVSFSALGIEAIKTMSVIGMIYTAICHPIRFCIIFGLILVVAIWLFKTAYITIRYFKNIYVKAFFKSFRGYDSEIPLVTPKIPKKVRRYVKESDIDIIIPVYILKKMSNQKSMSWHDRWWFVSTKDKQYICKPCFMKDTCYRIDLNNSIEKKMFIKKSLRFFEIFNLKGNEEDIGRLFRKVHKKIHFVFSKEYYYRYKEIKEITGFIDYSEYKKMIKESSKLSKREEREQKRQERLEAKEEQRIAKKASKNCKI